MAREQKQPRQETEETLADAVSRVMLEADDWRRTMRLNGDETLTINLDMKSPHAYIAVRPTLEIA